MAANAMSTASAVWFLIGPLDSTVATRFVPIYTTPFMIGRRQDLALPLNGKTVSNVHAEISEVGGSLMLRDLGSTNGTYVNGRRLNAPVTLREDDLVQFADQAFRVQQQSSHYSSNSHTVHENVCDRAMALVQFDKLMAERAVTPYFQPIVRLDNKRIIAYEVLGRSRLFGLETPKEMFRVAAQLNLEVELSVMLRWEGIQRSQAFGDRPHLFVNTHPRELDEPGLIESLEAVRLSNPGQALTLEIHESAVTDVKRMALIQDSLRKLNIGLAYDDFGAGQARLNELVACPPDSLKFDMSLIRGIDAASPQRQEMLATLVQMALKLGIVPLAEGVETEAESDVCQQMGFATGQGFFYGRPAPAKEHPAAGDARR
jgi:EAL domain-containing protein (putative c-di-GMP-specific phosphodiesterase class I)